MKKLFFASLFTLAVSISSFAADANKIKSNAANSFKSDFRNASNVTWTVTSDYARANFTADNQKMEAYYNLNGQMIATSRAIALDELPVNAKRTFAKRYSGYTVKEAIRFEGTDEPAYYISADNGTETVILKAGDNEGLTTFKKTKN